MQIGRFWGVDPASQFPSGYTGMGNDPANLTDPTGCVVSGGPNMGNNAAELGNGGDINDPFINIGGHMTDPTMGSTGGQEAIEALKSYQASLGQAYYGGGGWQPTAAEMQDRFVAGLISNGYTWWSDVPGLFSTYNAADNTTYWHQMDVVASSNYMDLQALASGQNSGASGLNAAANNSADLNPSTAGRNAYGLNYLGSKNPKSYNGDWNYTLPPKSIVDKYAKIHDMRYDLLHVSGGGGVIFDSRAIGADYHFIGGELSVFMNPFGNISDRWEAFSAGIIIFAGTLPKTVLTLADPSGTGPANIALWNDYTNKVK